MKKQREIIQDRAPLSDAEITQGKQPFENVLDQFNQITGNAAASGTKGLSSIGSWGMGIIGAAIIGAGIWVAASFLPDNRNEVAEEGIVIEDSLEAKNEQSDIDFTSAKKGINPPLPDHLTEEVFTINNRKKVIIETKNGSLLSIPAKAFVDQNGKTITRDIQIRYQDFHNPLDLFLSGIPMDYDSADVNYNFESAGMFQLFAEQDGSPLYLANDKTIEVELVSTDEDMFNQYYYDTIRQQWIYLKTEDNDMVTNLNEELASLDALLARSDDDNQSHDASAYSMEATPDNKQMTEVESYSLASKLRKKAIRNESRYSINITNQGESNGIYELLPNQAFKPEYYDVRWHEISVHKNPDDENYTISMRRGKTTLQFEGYPVLSEKEVSEAIEEYQSKQEKANQEQLAIENKKQAYFKVRKQRERIKQLINNNFVSTRKLEVRNLGTWNCDRPYPRVPLAARRIRGVITDTDGNAIEYSSLNIAQVGKNIIWKYPVRTPAFYNSEKRNVLWTLTSDNKLAVLHPQGFQQLQNGKISGITTYSIDDGLKVLGKYFN